MPTQGYMVGTIAVADVHGDIYKCATAMLNEDCVPTSASSFETPRPNERIIMSIAMFRQLLQADDVRTLMSTLPQPSVQLNRIKIIQRHARAHTWTTPERHSNQLASPPARQPCATFTILATSKHMLGTRQKISGEHQTI